MDRQGPRVVIPVGVLAMSAGLALATVREPAVASLPDARRARELWQRPRRLHRARLLPAELVRAPARHRPGHRVLGRGRRRDRPLSLAAGHDPRRRAGARPAGRWLALLLVLVPLNALFQRLRPEEHRSGAGRRCRTRRRRRSRPPSRQRGRCRVGGGGVDARARDTDGAILVGVRRLLHESLRLVRGAGPPDQVPHRGRLHAGGRGVRPRLRRARRRRRPDRRSATSPIASGGSGCGRSRAPGMSPATRSSSACAAFPTPALLYAMVLSQGVLGYGTLVGVRRHPRRAVPGPALWLRLRRAQPGGECGCGHGPWVTGVLYDCTGSYALAFWLAIVFSVASVVCIWLAAAPEGARGGRTGSRAGGLIASTAPDGRSPAAERAADPAAVRGALGDAESRGPRS